MKEQIQELIEGVSSKLIDKRQKDMLKLRKVSLNCSIQQNITTRDDKLYLITVVGANEDQVIKGFESFRKKCQKKL